MYSKLICSFLTAGNLHRILFSLWFYHQKNYQPYCQSVSNGHALRFQMQYLSHFLNIFSINSYINFYSIQNICYYHLYAYIDPIPLSTNWLRTPEILCIISRTVLDLPLSVVFLAFPFGLPTSGSLKSMNKIGFPCSPKTWLECPFCISPLLASLSKTSCPHCGFQDLSPISNLSDQNLNQVHLLKFSDLSLKPADTQTYVLLILHVQVRGYTLLPVSRKEGKGCNF